MEPSILSGEPNPSAFEPPAVAKPPLDLQPVTCGACRKQVAPDAAVFERGRWTCRGCVNRAAAAPVAPAAAPAPAPREASAASFVPALLGGAVGALVGAGIFAAIAIVAGIRVGYVAVLVGFLTGMGVRTGARGAVAPGLKPLAAGLAVFGIFASKYMVLAHSVMEKFDVSPVSGKLFGFFLENLGDLLSPFDVLWVVLAAGAAMRAVQGRRR